MRFEGIPELRAAAALFAHAPDETRTAIRKTNREMEPQIARIIHRHAGAARDGSKVDARIADSVRVRSGDRGVSVVVGSVGKVGRTPLRDVVWQYEFGTNDREHKTEYLSRQRTSKKAMKVTRRTRKQLPQRTAKGRMVYPAVAEIAPKLVTEWVRVIAQAVTPK